MKELNCEILEKATIGDKEYYVLNSIEENKTYKIPVGQLLKYDLRIGKRYLFYKKYKKNSKTFFLEYLNCTEILSNDIDVDYYESLGVYDFNILKIENKTTNKGEDISIFYVKDINNNIYTVLGLKWQNEKLWKFKTLQCQVLQIFKNSLLQLKNMDMRHPIFQIGNDYNFEIIGTKLIDTVNGSYSIYILKGEDGCIHDVNMFQGQTYNINAKEIVRCKVVKITKYIQLSQLNIKDSYYVPFNKIVVIKQLENKYFRNLFVEKDDSNQEICQLIGQYNSQSAFWVFTYAQILTKQLRDCIKRLDLKQLKDINNLIIIFEQWIITKGIVQALKDEEIRNNTILKAKRQLKKAKIIDEVLIVLEENQFDFISNDLFFNNKRNIFAKLYYMIRFSKIEIIDSVAFVNRVTELLKENDDISEYDRSCIKDLLYYISRSKKKFINEEDKEYFSLSYSKAAAFELTENEIKFISWSYSEMLLSEFLLMYEYKNILCGQILRLFSKSFHEVEKKEFVFSAAYKYFKNYKSKEFVLPFVFTDRLHFNFELLETETFVVDEHNKDWNELNTLSTSNSTFSVKLTKKSKIGYEVEFLDLKGFLPLQNVIDYKLKTYPLEYCNFTIDAKCLSISKTFKFFIVQQVVNYELNNNYKYNIPFVIGNIYDAIITNVQDYGLFLSTNAGEGLLHVNQIFDFNWDNFNIYKYFKKDKKIKVKLIEMQDNKASFNFYVIKDHDLVYYNEFISTTFQEGDVIASTQNTSDEETYFDNAQNEIAICIEQFAVLQTDITKKLHHLRIAKQFYAITKNARSFLINIFTTYFDILLQINDTLKDRSLKNIMEIKIKAKEFKEEINLKTIETFPDSDKLIFFLDIIGMFNERDENSQELLFNYIKKYTSEVVNKDLKTIAKITLANNLLISESKEDYEFSLKNLGFIFDYLSKGIFSLEETIDNKNERELKEEVFYWIERIKEDESEKLEFKSSFFTPIPDEAKLKKLETLRLLEKQTDQTRLEISKISGELAKRRIIYSSMKTLVAFANTFGGTLLIGINDEKKVIGLKNEYNTLEKKEQNRDGFGKFFDDKIRDYIGDSFSSLMSRKFLRFPSGDVLIIEVKPSLQEVFLQRDEEGGKSEHLYIRNLSSSKELKGSELAKFIKNKHIGQLYKNV